MVITSTSALGPAVFFLRVVRFLLALGLSTARLYHSVHNDEPEEATDDDHRELQPSHKRVATA